MKRYRVTLILTSTLHCADPIEAESAEQAAEIARNDYDASTRTSTEIEFLIGDERIEKVEVSEEVGT